MNFCCDEEGNLCESINKGVMHCANNKNCHYIKKLEQHKKHKESVKSLIEVFDTLTNEEKSIEYQILLDKLKEKG